MRKIVHVLSIVMALMIVGLILVITYYNIKPYLNKGTSRADNNLLAETTPDLQEPGTSADTDVSVYDSASAVPADESAEDTPVAAAEGLSGFDYDQMSDSRKSVYAQLYTGIAACKTVFYINADEPDDIGPALSGLLADHPEFFWTDGTASIYGVDGPGIKKMTVTYNMDPSEIDGIKAQIEAAADGFISGLPEGAGEYDIVKAAYEYVILNTDYDNTLSCAQNQNIQSVFINHESVCAGYAKAFQYLLQKAGLTCAYIEGDITDNGENRAHAWNLLKINGTYTFADPTWGDPNYNNDTVDTHAPKIIYSYLCMTSEEMSRSNHVPVSTYTLPDCTSADYDYYRLNGYYQETYDADTVKSVMNNAVDNNITEVHFKFSSFDDYAQAIARIYDGGLLNSILNRRLTWDQKSSLQYLSYKNDALCSIDIYW